jgi:hypothetical protein
LNEEYLYRVSGSTLFLILLFLLFVVSASGFLSGRRHSELVSDAVRSQISVLQGSLLGLLSLLLGFTFAMTVSRYDLRKQLLLEEANAIGTTYLRTQLLAEPYASEAASLLRRYVDLRVGLNKAGVNETNEQKLREASEQSEILHTQLWLVARNAASGDTRAVTTGLFIQSLNEVIDMHAKRLVALDNHVPEPVILLLWFVALFSLGLTGYSCGLAGWNHFFVLTMLALLIAVVISLIMDIDRPRRGLIQVSQKGMIMLHESMQKNTK